MYIPIKIVLLWWQLKDFELFGFIDPDSLLVILHNLHNYLVVKKKHSDRYSEEQWDEHWEHYLEKYTFWFWVAWFAMRIALASISIDLHNQLPNWDTVLLKLFIAFKNISFDCLTENVRNFQINLNNISIW